MARLRAGAQGSPHFSNCRLHTLDKEGGFAKPPAGVNSTKLSQSREKWVDLVLETLTLPLLTNLRNGLNFLHLVAHPSSKRVLLQYVLRFSTADSPADHP